MVKEMNKSSMQNLMNLKASENKQYSLSTKHNFLPIYIQTISDIQSQSQEIATRAAIYKTTNKNIDSTIHKMEYITYLSNLSRTM